MILPLRNVFAISIGRMYTIGVKSLRTIFSLVLILAIVIAGIYFVQTFQKGLQKPTTVINLNGASVIKELRDLNRLETASFTIEKIIDAGTSGNVFQEFIYGDKILLIAHGDVVGGFDLSQLDQNSVIVSGTTLQITLPKPQILSATLDNAQTRVYDRRLGLLSHGDKDLESKARLAATQSIQDAACKASILTEATNNARKQLTALFKALGFVNITIIIPQGSC